MTSRELREHFNNTFGLNEWPRTFEVDAETYGNVCSELLKYLLEKEKSLDGSPIYKNPDVFVLTIDVGNNGGIFFKGVELILK